MGAYNGHFQTNETQAVSKFSHPSKANWITLHAVYTELSIAEVERLWVRFQQLGCNEDGELTPAALQSKLLTDDAFVRNILKNFKSPSGVVSFESYLKAIKWCDECDIETKIRAIFNLLNNGNVVNEDMLFRILKRVYVDDSEEAVRRTVKVFFQELDPQGHGTINETEFVEGVMRLPMGMLNSVLTINILPDAMKSRLYTGVPEFGDSRGRQSVGSEHGIVPLKETGKMIPSDSVLREIAEKIHRRDWPRVANKLGFLSEDVQDFRTLFPTSTTHQVYHMLKTWREREGDYAYSEILEKALRETGMTDVSFILSP